MPATLPRLLLLPLAASLAAAAAACESGRTRPPDRSAPTTGATEARPRPEASSPDRARVEIVAVRDHDPQAYTQGLVFDDRGRLFESTGLRGASSLRELDPATGRVLRRRPLPAGSFGEGLAAVDGRLVQLTWREGRAFVWDADTFEPAGEFSYEGEGWGLCDDGTRLVMSDGSDRLQFRDRRTFAPRGSVRVTVAGMPLRALNELECVGARVYANVFTTDRIVEIDPATGAVTAMIDAASLPRPGNLVPGDVLNGIAFDRRRGTFLLTGKRWPKLYETVLRPPRPALADAGG